METRLKTIRIRLLCNGLYGCGKTSEIDYKITQRSLNGVLSDDKFTEEAILFGGINCPICGSSYAFRASKLKTMIIQ